MLQFFSRILLLALFGWLPLQAVSAPKFEDSMAQRTLACVGPATADQAAPVRTAITRGWRANQPVIFTTSC